MSIQPAIRPAILRGRRVDFWCAEAWDATFPGWRPRMGYWTDRNGGIMLAAADDRQSRIAIAALRGLGIGFTLDVEAARSAEAARAELWTCRLCPVPGYETRRNAERKPRENPSMDRSNRAEPALL